MALRAVLLFVAPRILLSKQFNKTVQYSYISASIIYTEPYF